MITIFISPEQMLNKYYFIVFLSIVITVTFSFNIWANTAHIDNKKTYSLSSSIEKKQFSNYSPSSPPICTGLTIPLNGDTDIPVTTILSWTRVSNSTGYKITAGTAPRANNILDAVDVGNVNSYQMPSKLPENTNIFVTITPYNDDGDALTCNEESFTTGPDIPPPNCTTLADPTPNSTDIGIRPILSWLPANTASGYLLTIGTTPSGTDILNLEDVGNVTNFNLSKDLANGTTFFVTITPYNLAGNSSNCPEISFTTGAESLRPECTTLVTPVPGAQAVPISTNLLWDPVPDAAGYIITLETFTTGIDVLNRIDVGDTTLYDIPGKLPEETTIYVIITPYNIYGETLGCTEQTFFTGIENIHRPPLFFTPNGDGVNDQWIVPNPKNQVRYVNIYNRQGKLLKQMEPASLEWEGILNGQLLPNDDYWFQIVFIEDDPLTGHFSLIR